MVSLNKQQGLSTRERKEAMPFKPNLQSSLAVLIALLVLLTACSPFSRNPVTASTPTVRPTHQVTPTHTVNTALDRCPAGLSQDPNCYTPQALRVAYGLEALLVCLNFLNLSNTQSHIILARSFHRAMLLRKPHSLIAWARSSSRRTQTFISRSLPNKGSPSSPVQATMAQPIGPISG